MAQAQGGEQREGFGYGCCEGIWGTILEGPFSQERQSMEKTLIGCFGPHPTAQLWLSSAPSLIPCPALGTP